MSNRDNKALFYGSFDIFVGTFLIAGKNVINEFTASSTPEPLHSIVVPLCVITGSLALLTGFFYLVGFMFFSRREAMINTNEITIDYYDGSQSCHRIYDQSKFSKVINTYVIDNIIKPLNEVYHEYNEMTLIIKPDDNDIRTKEKYERLYVENISFLNSLFDDLDKIKEDYENATDAHMRERIETSVTSNKEVKKGVKRLIKKAEKIKEEYEQMQLDIEQAMDELYKDYQYDSFKQVHNEDIIEMEQLERKYKAIKSK